MKTFIAVLGKGRGTWGHVARLIQEQDFDKILLISNEFGKNNFKPAKECEWLLVNARVGFESLKEEITKAIPEEGEIIISLISGTGKEHTALLAALKEKKKDFKLVILTGQGTQFF
jgi:hypothetical protein